MNLNTISLPWSARPMNACHANLIWSLADGERKWV
jgi:hypothetical protein